MNILFLDIDGVICTDRAYYACEQDKNKSVLRTWDPLAIRMIGRLVLDYDMQVVISSTWRKLYDVPLILLTHGFPCSFHEDEKTPTIARFSDVTRGSEIRAWLEEHDDKDIEQILILDDSTDGIRGTELAPFQTVTSFEDGFLTKNYLEARDIMDRQKNKKLKYELTW